MTEKKCGAEIRVSYQGSADEYVTFECEREPHPPEERHECVWEYVVNRRPPQQHALLTWTGDHREEDIPYVRQHEGIVVALHRLIRKGMGETRGADDAREDLDDLWRNLSKYEQYLASLLMSDLYLLRGESRKIPGWKVRPPAPDMRAAFALEVLESLRETRLCSPAHLKAFGACWKILGFTQASQEFMEAARTQEQPG